MVNRIETFNLYGVNNSQNNQGFQGLTPEFFGPPNPMDRMLDMQLCQQLGINPQGMDRNNVKANILSKLTGKPVDQMLAFYSSAGEQDMQKDMQALNGMGLEASHQPNMMMARAENKAMIANNWINNNDQNATNNNQLQGTQGPPPPPGSGERPGDPTINAMLDALGIQNTGSIEGDMQALLNAMMQNQQNNNDQNLTNNNQAQRPQGPPPPPGNGGRPGDPAINAMLDAFGIQNTGSIEGDIQALLNAMMQSQQIMNT